MSTITLTISGPDDAVEAGLIAFATHHGWTPASDLTAEDFATQHLTQYIRGGVESHIETVVGEQAKQAAVEAATAGLDAITIASQVGD